MSDLSKRHRTALFVDGDSLQSNPEYRERVKRLEESLNRSGSSPSGTIKVDVFTAFGLHAKSAPTSSIVKGVVTSQAASAGLTVDDLIAKGREMGYAQVLVDVPGK